MNIGRWYISTRSHCETTISVLHTLKCNPFNITIFSRLPPHDLIWKDKIGVRASAYSIPRQHDAQIATQVRVEQDTLVLIKGATPHEVHALGQNMHSDCTHLLDDEPQGASHAGQAIAVGPSLVDTHSPNLHMPWGEYSRIPPLGHCTGIPPTCCCTPICCSALICCLPPPPICI